MKRSFTFSILVVGVLPLLAIAESAGTECRIIRTKRVYSSSDGYHYSWHKAGQETSEWVAVDGTEIYQQVSMTPDPTYGGVGDSKSADEVERVTGIECRTR